MKVRFLVFVFAVVVLAAVVTGCGSRSPYVGSWNDHFGLGESRMAFSDDGTGSASGYCFGSGATFTWREDGDHIVIENWQGSGPHYDYAKISPDSDGLHATAPGTYLNFTREKE